MNGETTENHPAGDEPHGDSRREHVKRADGAPEIDDTLAWHLPDPGSHVTGSQLRRRVMTPEKIAEALEPERPSLLQRIFGRKPR